MYGIEFHCPPVPLSNGSGYSASSIIHAHIHIDRSVRSMADTGELEGPHPLQQRVGVVYRVPCGTCYKV